MYQALVLGAGPVQGALEGSPVLVSALGPLSPSRCRWQHQARMGQRLLRSGAGTCLSGRSSKARQARSHLGMAFVL